MFKLLVMSLFSLSAFAANPAFAFEDEYETITLERDVTVNDSEVKSISLGAARHVKNIVVQAQGISTDSTIEVMVNGDVKGTIYAPGADPSYVVTIEETTRSIEFRHRTGGSMRIMSIVGTVSVWEGTHGGGYSNFYGDYNQAKALAATALEQVEILTAFATLKEEQRYLFPIKKHAGMVFVMSSSHGNLSSSTIRQLQALKDQIDFARRYLTGNLMQKDGAFDSVVELLTVSETIEDLLD